MSNQIKLKLNNAISNFGWFFLLSYYLPAALKWVLLKFIGAVMPEFIVSNVFDVNLLLFLRGVGLILYIALCIRGAKDHIPYLKKRLFAAKLELKTILILIPLTITAEYSISIIIGMLRRYMSGGSILGFMGGTVVKSVDGISLAITIMVTVILAPIVEEYLYRYILMDAFDVFFSSNKISVLVQCIIFGACHLSILGGTNAFLFGIVFTLVILWTGNIMAGVIVHALSNLMNILLDYLYNTGIIESSITSGENVIRFGLPCAIIAGILLYVIYRGRKFDISNEKNPIINATT